MTFYKVSTLCFFLQILKEYVWKYELLFISLTSFLFPLLSSSQCFTLYFPHILLQRLDLVFYSKINSTR